MSSDIAQLYSLGRQVGSDLGVAADEEQSWNLIAELGWLMVSAPEESGGLGMGLAGECALHSELGRVLATVPFLPAMLAIDALSGADFPGRDDLLERLTAGGEYLATPLSGSDFTARQDGDGLIISGSASGLPSADRASRALVYTSDNDCVALVDLQSEGTVLSARQTWDSTRRLYDLELTDVAIDSAEVVARGADAERLISRLLIRRDFGLAADAAGGASALLETTVEYLQTRQQFGRPLALFQALKHRCADLKALIDAAEALLLDSLDRVGELTGDDDSLAAADMLGRAARQLACSAYAAMAEEALQLHGGIGMTSEHECHLYLKRAMLSEHLGRCEDGYDVELAARFMADAG